MNITENKGTSTLNDITFYRDKENQKILLVPENDNYETRVVDYCRIQGIARKVIKDTV